MFVFSVKTSKSKIAAVIIAIVAVVIAAVMLIGKSDEPAATDQAINVKAENAEERAAFLAQFGWEIDEEPVEVREIIIPEDFDKGYKDYSELNKKNGFDLEVYKGERVKMWVYDILNYPGFEGRHGVVQATILVFDGRVIGGDVSSLEQNGFTAGFEMPVAETTQKQ